MKLSCITAHWLFPLLGWLGAGGVCSAANVDYFADNGCGNPVSTLQHPCAEHFNGVT